MVSGGRPVDRLNAFVAHSDVRIEGEQDGPLSGLIFAVKDLYDIAGYPTGCGNPDWLKTHPPAERTAPAVADLLTAGATCIGKTQTDELAYALNGENAHYGTPVNVNAPGRIPGGSSSGSAAAVAGGLVDFALGTDTGGSVRVPASYCGIYGIRTTQNRITLAGVMPLAPGFDTLGWFARDPAIMGKVGRILLPGWSDPRPAKRILFPEDVWALVDEDVRAALEPALQRLYNAVGAPESVTLADSELEEWMPAFRILQGAEVWRVHGDWFREAGPVFGPGISERIQWAGRIQASEVEAAFKVRRTAQQRMQALLEDDVVMALPAAPGIAPPVGAVGAALERQRTRTLRLSTLAPLAGVPQLTLPAGRLEDCPVGLSMLGCREGDEGLLALAEAVGEVVPPGSYSS